MDITLLFRKLIPSDQQIPKPTLKETFYDQLNYELEKLTLSIEKCISYAALLRKEENLSRIQYSVSLMNNLKINNEGNGNQDISNDEMVHFDGIKKILSRKIKYSQLKINGKKTNFVGQNIELAPECDVKNRGNKRRRDYSNDLDQDLEDNKNSKKFNRNYNPIFDDNAPNPKSYPKNDLTHDEMIQETVDQEQKSKNTQIHKQLYEIQHIQSIITSELLEQDERIDKIIGVIPEVETLKIESRNNGRLMRRFLCVFVYCSAFILLYVYFCQKFFK